MPFLTTQQRSILEKACERARVYAEVGAVNALQALAVDIALPSWMVDERKKELRRQLRAKARALGDTTREGDGHGIEKLATELAYEVWHQMLFAHYLVENDLLIHPGYGIAVGAQDLDGLAETEGFANAAEAATAYASQMLPMIFRVGDPLLAVEYDAKYKSDLENVLKELDASIFWADDSLGWVYQFWQSAEKKRINDSGNKIDGKSLPAVTQLFSEPYMVQFMLDNTIGAWWLYHHPGQPLPLPTPYLKLMDDGSPAAGGYEAWPTTVTALKIIDPCMGSGHFLAAALQYLMPLMAEETGLLPQRCIEVLLTEVLHGLELDPRCAQIAAFNLAMTAWKLNEGYFSLPKLNLACTGQKLPIRSDWMAMAGQYPALRKAFERLHVLWQDGNYLGSLIQTEKILNDEELKLIRPELPQILKSIEQEHNDFSEQAVVAAGLLTASTILNSAYDLVITNPPYLGKGKMQDKLKADVDNYFKDASGDLANVFLERCLLLAGRGGMVTFVMPQNWLFLKTYEKQRKKLLGTPITIDGKTEIYDGKTWNWLARLGPGAFRGISGEVVQAILLSITNGKPTKDHTFLGMDVSTAKSADEKLNALQTVEVLRLNQMAQTLNPDYKIVIAETQHYLPLMSKYASCFVGMHVGGWDQHKRCFWELPSNNGDWSYIQGSVGGSFIDGCHYYSFWPNDGQSHRLNPNARVQGEPAWNKTGITIKPMGELAFALYTGTLFDNNTCVYIPHEPANLPAIWCYATSGELQIQIRKLDQKLNVTNAVFEQIPFDLAHWQQVAKEHFPNGLPQPYTDDPTQWLFHGHPGYAEPGTELHVALARFLGYRWPAESDTEMKLDPKARGLIAAIAPFNALSDQDGIAALVAIDQEVPLHNRLWDYIESVWGADFDPATTISNLVLEANERFKGKAKSLEDWLQNEFFEQHCALFHQRPFLWHVSDGLKKGFGVVVNYHKLNKEALDKVIVSYLGNWLMRQKLQDQEGVSGAPALYYAAQQLETKLKAILEGEPPYDIFVRWKALADQPIGWDPDLNHGVRLNIRPFLNAEVLHKQPKIGKYEKLSGTYKLGVDRGKDPATAPWGEDRDNDRHLYLEQKITAKAPIKSIYSDLLFISGTVIGKDGDNLTVTSNERSYILNAPSNSIDLGSKLSFAGYFIEHSSGIFSSKGPVFVFGSAWTKEFWVVLLYLELLKGASYDRAISFLLKSWIVNTRFVLELFEFIVFIKAPQSHIASLRQIRNQVAHGTI